MKKFIYSILFTIILVSATSSVFSRPIYFGFRIGLFAKWEVTGGECQNGWGACLSYAQVHDEINAELGYDVLNSTVFFLRIARSSNVAANFSNGKFELKEDSPIDPKLISKFVDFKNPEKKVVTVNKGIYPVKTSGNFYIITLNYRLNN